MTKISQGEENQLKKRSAIEKVIVEQPLEKKLKVTNQTVPVMTRRSRRGQIKSSEIFENNRENNNIINEDENELRVRKKVKISIEETKDEPNSSGTEEYSDSEDESGSSDESEEIINTIKRPVFIRKEDRYVQERELEKELKAKLEEKRIKQSIKEQNK